MTDVQTPATQAEPSRLTFELKTPYTVHPNAIPASFLIKGLVRTGTMASLGGKPKIGKSSLARYMAVCVAKGEPFLGRATKRGEVLLISIEDDETIVNTSLETFGWNPNTDAAIHFVTDVGALNDRLPKLRSALQDHPTIKLVIIDHLSKFTRADDGNSYDDWLDVFATMRDLLKEFPQVSAVMTVHNKKVTPDDVFDSILGSTGIRAEFGANMAIFDDAGKRFFTSELRFGKKIDPVELLATIEEVKVFGSEPDENGEHPTVDVPAHFDIGTSKAVLDSETRAKTDHNKEQGYESRIIELLRSAPDGVLYNTVLDNVRGKTANVIASIKNLLAAEVITATGEKSSKSDPYTLHPNEGQLKMWEFTHRFAA